MYVVQIHSEIPKGNFADSAVRATSMGTVWPVRSGQVIPTEGMTWAIAHGENKLRQSEILTTYSDKGMSIYVCIYESKV